MMVVSASTALTIMSLGLGGEAGGSPERSGQPRMEVRAAARTVGPVALVSVPDRPVLSGGRQLAPAAVVWLPAVGPGRDGTATAGRDRAASALWDW